MSRLSKEVKKSVFSVFLVAMIIIATVLFQKNVSRILSTSAKARRFLNQPVTVEVAKVQKKEYHKVIGAAGKAMPSNLIAIDKDRENLATRVKEVYVDVGEFITKGQTLLEFDTKALQATLESDQARVRQARTTLEEIVRNQETRSVELRKELDTAKALLTRAKSRIAKEEENYTRQRNLFDDGIISKLDYDIARERRDSARAELEEAETRFLKAKNNLGNERINNEAQLQRAESELKEAVAKLSETEADIDNAVVISSLDGIVMERHCNRNEIINYGERIIVLGAIAPIYFMARVPQENLLDIHLGQDADVIFDSSPNRTFKGKVVKVDPQVEAASGTFKVYIEIGNTDSRLRPGLTGSARITDSREILSVPRLGVVRKGRDAMVFVVEKDEKGKERAVIRKIVIGDTVSVHELEILEGLSEGEPVVVHGLKYLREGDLVLIREKRKGVDKIDIDVGVDMGGE